MASNFDRFIANMIGAPDFGTSSAVSRTPDPRLVAPVRAPMPSPYAGGQPQQGLPPELLNMILSVNRPQSERQQQPAPSPTPQQVQAAARTNPATMAMASSAPTVGPPKPETQEAYYFVEHVDGSGETRRFFVPERYIERLPDSAVVNEGMGPVTDPVIIENARNNGALLEQQPEEVQFAFRDSPTIEERNEQGDGTVHVDPATGQTTFYEHPIVETYTVDQVREFNPEMAGAMTAAGITEVRSDQEVFYDEQGGLVVLDKEDADAARAEAEAAAAEQARIDGPQNPEPVGTDLPGLTTKDLRDRGMDAEANELEASGIYSVPDGYMAVRGEDGMVRNVPMPANGEMPSNPNIVVFGGRSEERIDRGTGGMQVLSALDAPRQWNAYGHAEDWYQYQDQKRQAAEQGIDLPPDPYWDADPYTGTGFEHIPEGYEWLNDPEQRANGEEFNVWLLENEDEAMRVYEEGYTAPATGETFTGSAAIWERYMADQPILRRAVTDIRYDPLNVATGVGSVGIKIGGRILRPVGTVGDISRGRRLLGRGTQLAGRALQVPDAAVDAALFPLLRGAGQTARLIPGVDEAVEWATRERFSSRVRNATEAGQQTMDDFALKSETAAPEPPPAQVATDSSSTAPLSQSGDISVQEVSPRSRNDADFIAGDDGIFPSPFARENPPVQTATRTSGGVVVTPEEAAARINSGEWMRSDQRRTTARRGDPNDIFYDERSGKTYSRDQVTPTVDNPFAGMKIGEQPDWDFLTPRAREDMGLQEQNRIIDEIYQQYGDTPEYRYFGERYEVPAREFIETERQAFEASKASKAERGGARDFAQDRRMALAEADHIVNDLLPIYREAFGEAAEVPMHRINPVLEFRNRKTGKPNPVEKQGDGYFISQAIFSEDQKIQRYSVNRLQQMARGGNTDVTPELLNDIAGLRERYIQFRTNADMGDARAAMNEQSAVRREADAALRRERGFTGRADDGDPRTQVPLDDTPGVDVPSPETRTEYVRPEPQPRAASTDGLERLDVPVSRLRSTATASPEQLEAAGLPRLQPRGDAFSETSVNAIDNVGWDWNLYDDIIVTRGNDGEIYIIAGHSRVEAARRLGQPTLPAKVVDNSDPNYLRQIAEETNTNRAGYTPMERARMANEAVQRGESLEDIGVRQGMASNARRTSGTADARRYSEMANITQESHPRLYELVNQGYIDTPTAAAIGRAIDLDYLGNGELTKIVQNINSGRWTEQDVVRLIDGNIAMQQRQSVSAMSLFGDAAPKSQAEQMADDIKRGLNELGPEDNRLEFIESHMGEMATTRTDAIAALRRDYPEAYNRGRRGDNQFSPERIADEGKRAQFDRDVQAIRELSDILGIEPDRALVSTAASPFTAHTSVIPGGPQLSNWLSEPVSAVPEGRLPSLRNTDELELPSVQRDAQNRQYLRENPNPEQANQFVSSSTAPIDRFRGRTLNERESRFFNKRFSDGTSYRDRYSQYADELENGIGGQDALPRAEAEAETAKRMMDDISEDMLRDEPRRWKYYQDELDSILKKEKNIDPAVARVRALGTATSSSPIKALRAYDTGLAMLREITLYNPITGMRYIMTQAAGNPMTMLLNKEFRMMKTYADPRTLRRSYAQMNNDPTDIGNRILSKFIDDKMDYNDIVKAYKDSGEMPLSVFHDSMDELMVELNMGGMRQHVSKPVRDQIGEMVEGKTNTARIAERLRLGKFKLPKTGWLANKHVRDMAGAWDVGSRRAMYDHTFRTNIADAAPAFRQHMLDNAPVGVDRQMVDDLWDSNMPDLFGGDRIRDVFEEVPNKGYVERMARDWENSLNKMDKHARNEVNRLFFSGNQTNADAVLGRIVFFHYWMSRAIPLYTQAMMREPAYLVNYIRMQEAMDKQFESGEMSPAVKSMYKIFGSYGGYNVFIRPDALIETVMTMGRGDDWTPEGESGVGWLLRQSPFMINPVIDGVTNLMGLQGDNFAPDPFMLNNHATLVTNIFNLADSRTDDGGPNQNYYQNAWSFLRDKTSGVTSRFIPGADHIEYMDSTVYARRDINYLIQTNAEAQGLDPNSPEVMAAMEDPSSPLYREAFKQYANAHGLMHVARILPTGMLYPKIRVTKNDDIRKGIATTDGQEQQDWFDQRESAQVASPEARALMVQGDEYYSIGTDQQRADYSTYNAIRYGGMDQPVFVNGERMDDITMSGMTEDERKDVADQWAEESGVTADIDFVREGRKEYRDTHPEWSEYVQWSGTVRDQNADVFWQDAIRKNENAERWFNENARDILSPSERERKLISVEAYMAVEGVHASVYDPAPLPTNTGEQEPYNPATSAGASDSGSGPSLTYGETAAGIRDDMDEYEQEMTEFSSQSGGINIDGLNPMARSATISNMQDRGIYVPSKSARLRRYEQWRDQQPAGSDTSPEAYEEWYKANNP